MPFVQARISKKLNSEEKSALKSEILSIIGRELSKPANFIMIGIEDGYELWLGENQLENGAMISVQHLGKASRNAYSAISDKITGVLRQKLGTDPACVYITFQEIPDWSWNGSLF